MRTTGADTTTRRATLLELTLQALLLTLGAIFGVRFNAAKSFYLHSGNANGGSLELCMLDSDGRWSKQVVMAAKPDKEAWGHDGQGSSGGGRRTWDHGSAMWRPLEPTDG